MSLLSDDDVGCVCQVTGRVYSVITGETGENGATPAVSLQVDSIQRIGGRPEPGAVILVRVNREWKLATYKQHSNVADYAGTEEFGGVCWFNIKEPSPEEVRAEKEKRQKQKSDTWRKQASEIPTDVLLDVIKERTKRD